MRTDYSKSYTVERRVLIECCPVEGERPAHVGKGGCGKTWITATESFGPVDSYGRRSSRLKLPSYCPVCNGWNLQMRAKLQVSESNSTKPHNCENTCQWSESAKCKCACGGKMHGIALKMLELA